MSTAAEPPMSAEELYRRYRLLHEPAAGSGLEQVRAVKLGGRWFELVHDHSNGGHHEESPIIIAS